METIRAFQSLARSAVMVAALVSAPVAASAQVAPMTSQPAASTSGTGPATDKPASIIRVDITNNGVLDAVVYAYRWSQRHRLGLVVAHTTATLELPLNFTEDGEAQLYVHRVGERPDNDFLSNAVHIGSGLRPVLYVEPDVQLSSFAVFSDRE